MRHIAKLRGEGAILRPQHRQAVFPVGINERDSKGLGVSLLCSQAARAWWADATEVLCVEAAKFACWTSNSALAPALPVSNRAASADSRSPLAACSKGEYRRRALDNVEIDVGPGSRSLAGSQP
jgi:hypothetical protein